MSKEIKIDNLLDNNLRNLSIGGVATPIELATDKVKINEKTTFSKDLVIKGDLFIEGSTADINMTDGIEIETTSVAGHVTVRSNALSINSALYGGDGDSTDNQAALGLIPSSGYDAKILLYDASSIRWSIGNDADDSNSLKIDVGNTTVGGDTKMTLDTSGNLTLVGDLAVNGDTITTDGSMTLDSGGSLTMDSANGRFVASKDGTEFSVASCAFAGMILGYRMIGEDAVHDTYTLTTSFAVPDSAMTVRFAAPPSGCVEVMVQIYANASTSNRILYFGLSDNATYNSIGATYEQLHRMPDETDDTLVQHYWTITGLTSGSIYNYWFGAKISGTSAFLNWGGTASARYGDFIMKVTALPSAVSDFAEYD